MASAMPKRLSLSASLKKRVLLDINYNKDTFVLDCTISEARGFVDSDVGDTLFLCLEMRRLKEKALYKRSKTAVTSNPTIFHETFSFMISPYLSDANWKLHIEIW